MVDGLKLTISGEELRALLLARIRHHEERAEWWAHEETRTPEEQTETEPLLPEHMCRNEAERHEWRGEVLAFIRDHLETGETYRLDAADLEFGELLPARPGWVVQDDYETRTRIGCSLERMARSIDGLVGAAHGWLYRHDHAQEADDGANRAGVIEETEEFRTTRVDTGGGPEVIMIERK